jgi:hypothetical protein
VIDEDWWRRTAAAERDAALLAFLVEQSPTPGPRIWWQMPLPSDQPARPVE